MTFQEAINQILNNKRVRRKTWGAGESLGYTERMIEGRSEGKKFSHRNDAVGFIVQYGIFHPFSLSLSDTLATDWEEYQPPKFPEEKPKKKKFFK